MKQPKDKRRIIVSGFIGSFCISGISWHYAQFALGLQLLGHDVYYIEDTCGVNHFHDPNYEWNDPTPVVNYLRTVMQYLGLDDRWAYKDESSGQWFGLPDSKVKDIIASADLVISVSNALYFREEYLKIPKRVLIDTDPMFTQIPPEVAKPLLSKFTHHFSFGTNINDSDCKVPTLGYTWFTTVQPVCLSFWGNEISKVIPDKKIFTTVMNLSPKNRFKYNGEEWGQKDMELQKIIDLPLKVKNVIIEMGVTGGSGDYPDHKWLTDTGWELKTDLTQINKDISQYSQYIKSSFGEFSVAKQTYVKGNTGWFSDRTACYLASGRPAIVQETQWSRHIPGGIGVIPFTSKDSAVEAINEVANNYFAHSKAATEIAHEYFESSKVMGSILDQVNNNKWKN